MVLTKRTRRRDSLPHPLRYGRSCPPQILQQVFEVRAPACPVMAGWYFMKQTVRPLRFKKRDELAVRGDETRFVGPHIPIHLQRHFEIGDQLCQLLHLSQKEGTRMTRDLGKEVWPGQCQVKGTVEKCHTSDNSAYLRRKKMLLVRKQTS